VPEMLQLSGLACCCKRSPLS